MKSEYPDLPHICMNCKRHCGNEPCPDCGGLEFHDRIVIRFHCIKCGCMHGVYMDEKLKAGDVHQECSDKDTYHLDSTLLDQE